MILPYILKTIWCIKIIPLDNESLWLVADLKIKVSHCDPYFTIQWFFYVPPPKVGEGHIGFSTDPVGVGVRVGVGMTDSCTHNISWTSWWNSTIFAWIYHWDKLKSWLGFGDLDLILKVTGGFRWQILVPMISHETEDGIPPNLPECITGASLRAD